VGGGGPVFLRGFWVTGTAVDRRAQFGGGGRAKGPKKGTVLVLNGIFFSWCRPIRGGASLLARCFLARCQAGRFFRPLRGGLVAGGHRPVARLNRGLGGGPGEFSGTFTCSPAGFPVLAGFFDGGTKPAQKGGAGQHARAKKKGGPVWREKRGSTPGGRGETPVGPGP